jgi:hypothetical protein
LALHQLFDFSAGCLDVYFQSLTFGTQGLEQIV